MVATRMKLVRCSTYDKSNYGYRNDLQCSADGGKVMEPRPRRLPDHFGLTHPRTITGHG